MRPARFDALVLATGLAITVAACGSGPTGATPTSVASSEPTALATRIDVRLTDALRIEPAVITVPAGVPVTFVVANVGAIDHEFFLGDEAAQQEHEAEMQSMGGMAHDEPMGIGVAPGQTKELTVTFDEPGETLAGCHVAGHYGGGMVATVRIEG